MKSTTQTYNSGLIRISRVGNTAEPGEFPVDGLVKKHDNIPFEDRTVGMSRFFQGLQQDVRVTRLIRCPRLSDVNAFDVVTVKSESDRVCQIRQIQYPVNVEPPSMDLSLTDELVKEDLSPVTLEEGGGAGDS